MELLSWTKWAIATIKTWWYASAVLVFEYLDIPSEQFLILAVLMVIDFMAWISKQYVLDPKEITSHRASIWALKKAWILIIVLALSLTLNWVWFWEKNDYIVAFLGVLIMSEMYSIIQNVYTMRTWQKVSEYDALSIIIKKLWDIFVAMIERSLESISKKK